MPTITGLATNLLGYKAWVLGHPEERGLSKGLRDNERALVALGGTWLLGFTGVDSISWDRPLSNIPGRRS